MGNGDIEMHGVSMTAFGGVLDRPSRASPHVCGSAIARVLHAGIKKPALAPSCLHGAI